MSRGECHDRLDCHRKRLSNPTEKATAVNKVEQEAAAAVKQAEEAAAAVKQAEEAAAATFDQ